MFDIKIRQYLDKITIPYYEDKDRISNSAIGVFIKQGARCLNNLFTGKAANLTAAYLERGTMIHMFILQPNEFWDNYIIINYEAPKSDQQKKFAKTFVDSLELEHDKRVLEAFKAAYSTNGKTEDKMLAEGLEIAEKLSGYIDFLNAENNHKKVISWSDYSMLNQIKDNLKNHVMANKLLFDIPETTEAYNELHINWEFPKKYEDLNMSCKSLLDRLTIDHTNKTVTLIDIKTSFDLHNFDIHVRDYDYIRQLSYYWLAIHWLFKNVLDIEIADYTLKTYIIAISTTDNNPIRVIEFKEPHLEEAVDRISSNMANIAWHIKNDKWDHSREYYENDGIEQYKP